MAPFVALKFVGMTDLSFKLRDVKLFASLFKENYISNISYLTKFVEQVRENNINKKYII